MWRCRPPPHCPEKPVRKSEPTRPRGRPRSTLCHHAILRATKELLGERRYSDVTMEGIAERAGVAKQTLYKWWPSKARLAMEAWTALANSKIRTPETGQASSDLLQLARDTCRVLSRTNIGQTVAGLIAEAQSDPELAVEFRETYIGARRRVAAGVLEAGIARGELRPDIDVQEVLDLMYGPIWYRLLLRNAPLDDRFARSLVAHLLPSLVCNKVVPKRRVATR